MASTDALPVPKKNVAYRVTFAILDADGDLVTGAAGLDSEISKDGGTFADCTNEATEIATSSGMYYLDLTSTEMNADTVAIIVKTSTTGAKTTSIVMYPEEAGDIRVNVTQVNGTTQTAGDLAALINTVGGYVDTEIGTIIGYIDTEVAAIKAKTDQLTFTTANKVDATIQAGGDFAQAAADKVWSTTVRTLSAAGVQAIWDALTSALTTAGSIGKKIVDNLDATISSRASQTSLDTLDDYVDTEVAAIKAKTDNLPEGVTKNAALSNFMFLMVDSSDHVTPKTGLTVTATRSIDGAAFASCANAVSEIGNGVYKLNLAAADLNGDVIALKFTATGADQTTIVLKTEA